MAAHPAQTPSLISTYNGELHVGASFGSVVRLSCANLNDPEAAPQTVDFQYVPPLFIFSRDPTQRCCLTLSLFAICFFRSVSIPLSRIFASYI